MGVVVGGGDERRYSKKVLVLIPTCDSEPVSTKMLA